VLIPVLRGAACIIKSMVGDISYDMCICFFGGRARVPRFHAVKVNVVIRGGLLLCGVGY